MDQIECFDGVNLSNYFKKINNNEKATSISHSSIEFGVDRILANRQYHSSLQVY